MSARPPVYLLDANVFIQAHRRFYPFDICPGYWESLKWHRTKGNVISLDKVAIELKQGSDKLWEWAKKDFSKEGFVSSKSCDKAYQKVVSCVQEGDYFDQAKNDFANKADGWLVAYAWQEGCVLVTLEEYKDNAKKVVPIPNLCKQFGVEWISPFDMLKRLGIKFDWQPPS